MCTIWVVHLDDRTSWVGQFGKLHLRDSELSQPLEEIPHYHLEFIIRIEEVISPRTNALAQHMNLHL